MATTSSVTPLGEEKEVRAAVLGLHDLAGHLSFYPNSIVKDHLGKIFFWGSAIAIGSGLAARLAIRARDSPEIRRHDTTRRSCFRFFFWPELCCGRFLF